MGTYFIYYLILIQTILFTALLGKKFLFYSQNSSTTIEQSYPEVYAPTCTSINFYMPEEPTGKLIGGPSLKFPVQFHGKIRDIKLIGKTYS